MIRLIKGFTLIEIMIVLVILAVIAFVAIPTYFDSILKARRTDGRNALMALQVNQEKFRSNCSQYATVIGSLDTCTTGTYAVEGSSTSTDGHYTIAISSGTASATGYTATASATGAQVDDTDCATLTLTVNSANPEGVFTPADCW